MSTRDSSGTRGSSDVRTVTTRTRSCSAYMCWRWWVSVSGTPRVTDERKAAVPGKRGGGWLLGELRETACVAPHVCGARVPANPGPRAPGEHYEGKGSRNEQRKPPAFDQLDRVCSKKTQVDQQNRPVHRHNENRIEAPL